MNGQWKQATKSVNTFKNAFKEPPKVVMGPGIKDQVGSGNVQLHFDFALLALPS